MIPQGFGILRQVFPPDEIHKAFGLFGPVIGLSAVLGPIVGGALTDGDLFGLGWRAIFSRRSISAAPRSSRSAPACSSTH